ncbi:hypothetical protein BB561_002330 [Smittium simulii]|uniref:Phosphatidylethanolamine-binding protein n=1 Tax=Smittium simulii TaxID=133385 RepID=A0A2T9YQU2_9FUNG|nr:hypothetical protein BB561_002330 [Smittium simulii]
MKFTFVTSLISILALTAVKAEDDQAILSALRSGEIIPNILPVFDPSTDFEVTYVNRPMNFGTEYFPFKNETDNLPTFKYEADSDDFYTIALIDPDAPSRANPFRSQVRHWLSVNIPGNNVAAGNSTGTPYLAPRPFPGCGRKRFVYVLAKQESNMPNLSVSAARPNFNIANFAEDNNMEIIGANYFEVEAQPGATCTIPGAQPSSTTPSSSPSSSPSSTPSSSASSTPSSTPSDIKSDTKSNSNSKSSAASGTSNTITLFTTLVSLLFLGVAIN